MYWGGRVCARACRVYQATSNITDTPLEDARITIDLRWLCDSLETNCYIEGPKKCHFVLSPADSIPHLFALHGAPLTRPIPRLPPWCRIRPFPWMR